jgi:hypothetical protein
VWFDSKCSARHLQSAYFDIACKALGKKSMLLRAQQDMRLVMRAQLHNGHTELPAEGYSACAELVQDADGEDSVWRAVTPILVPNYSPHCMSAIVLTLLLRAGGGRGTVGGWDMCIGWAPVVPYADKQTQGGADGLSGQGAGQLALGYWRLAVRHQVGAGTRGVGLSGLDSSTRSSKSTTSNASHA